MEKGCGWLTRSCAGERDHCFEFVVMKRFRNRSAAFNLHFITTALFYTSTHSLTHPPTLPPTTAAVALHFCAHHHMCMTSIRCVSSENKHSRPSMETNSIPWPTLLFSLSIRKMSDALEYRTISCMVDGQFSVEHLSDSGNGGQTRTGHPQSYQINSSTAASHLSSVGGR